MKRDMDVLRQIVLAVEALNPGQSLKELEGVHPAVFRLHAQLLYDDGYVKGERLEVYGGPVFYLKQLTTPGYDFADSVRNEKNWERAKEQASAVGGWTLKILASLAERLLEKALGLD